MSSYTLSLREPHEPFLKSTCCQEQSTHPFTRAHLTSRLSGLNPDRSQTLCVEVEQYFTVVVTLHISYTMQVSHTTRWIVLTCLLQPLCGRSMHACLPACLCSTLPVPVCALLDKSAKHSPPCCVPWIFHAHNFLPQTVNNASVVCSSFKLYTRTA